MYVQMGSHNEQGVIDFFKVILRVYMCLCYEVGYLAQLRNEVNARK
jgi:hypothetical protein